MRKPRAILNDHPTDIWACLPALPIAYRLQSRANFPNARQPGPADAVESAVEHQRPAVDGEGALDDEDSAQDGAQDEAVERGEYSAAVADQDMEADVCRAMKRVEVSLRKAHLLAAQRARQDSMMARTQGMAGYEDRDLEARMAAAVTEIQSAAAECKQKEMQRDLEKAEQEIQRTAFPPGIRARAANGSGRGSQRRSRQFLEGCCSNRERDREHVCAWLLERV